MTTALLVKGQVMLNEIVSRIMPQAQLRKSTTTRIPILYESKDCGNEEKQIIDAHADEIEKILEEEE